MPTKKLCKDCIAEGITTARVAKYPGPRCTTHHRAVKKLRSSTNWEIRLQATYNITPTQYWALYEFQGGKCYICQRATGARRRLAVDHDHTCCKGATSCGKCVRGLLCRTDNSHLGFLRDDPEAFHRAAYYLENPPAKHVLETLTNNDLSSIIED